MTAAAPIPHDPIDALIRTSLTDDDAWATVLADPVKKQRAEVWLRTTKKDLEEQLASRTTDFRTYRASGHHADYGAKRGEFYSWRARTIRLQNHCDRRLGQLRVMRQQVQANVDRFREPLFQLTACLRDAEREPGTVTVGQLTALIDSIALGGAGTGDATTLREALRVHEERSRIIAAHQRRGV